MDGWTRGALVVGVDPAGPARDAAGWAARLAAAWTAPLDLLHAAAPGPPPRWLADLAALARRGGADPVRTEVVPGPPAAALAARAAGARMLVLGSHGAGTSSGMLAGVLALEVLDRAGCPVAVVRGGGPGAPPPSAGPVVAGVDGSASGRAALRLAADLAAALGADVLALHAHARARRARGAGTGPPPADLLAAELAALTAARPAAGALGRLVDDTPLRPLLRSAGSARALVVGQRGDAVAPTMQHLGSTSRALVEFAPCPVVVVPAVASCPVVVVPAVAPVPAGGRPG